MRAAFYYYLILSLLFGEYVLSLRCISRHAACGCEKHLPSQDQKGYESLRLAWLALGERERSSLTDHFLADGIKEVDLC